MKLVKLTAVACLLVFSAGYVGAEEIIECEHAKLNTEDATPVDPGQWEIELSYEFVRARRAFTDSWARTPRPFLRGEGYGLGVTYGVVENLNIGIGLGYASVYDRDADELHVRGLTDLEIGAKWRFYRDEARRLEIAYVPALTLPTGEDEVTDDFFNLYNGIAVSKDWTDRLTSNFDFGYNQAIGGHRGGYSGTLSANAALGYHITDWLQPEIELNYAHDFNHDDDADLIAATAGFIVCLRDNVRLDVGVQRALAGQNADHGTAFLAALTFAF